MNVAAIAISLPVALVVAPYLNIAPEVILFVSLVTAGMPFILIVGAAPNAIAYNSKQFTSGEFFMAGIPASIILLALLPSEYMILSLFTAAATCTLRFSGGDTLHLVSHMPDAE